MTQENFTSEVYARWPYRNQRTDEELKAILEDIGNFAYGKSPSILDDVFAEYRSMKPPKGFAMWWFYNQVGSEGKSGVWWRRCENGHLYEHKGSACPICGSVYYKIAHGDTMPSETIQIQESCSSCKWYKESLSDPVRGLYGASCQEYGTEKHGNCQECKDCKCTDCCKMALLYKTNEHEYRNMVGDLIENKFKESNLEWATK